MDELKPTLRFIFSVDDGDARDVEVAEMLMRYRLPGLFYLPSYCGLDKADVLWLDKLGFEIGGHTVSHPEDLKRLPSDELRYEIEANKYHLEDCLAKPVTKFCYPSGRYNEKVIEEVVRAGYLEARTTLVCKVKARGPFRTDTTIHIYPRSEYEGMEWDLIAKNYCDYASRTGGYFHIWCHAADLDNFNYWVKLEEFFEWLSTNYQIIKI